MGLVKLCRAFKRWRTSYCVSGVTAASCEPYTISQSIQTAVCVFQLASDLYPWRCCFVRGWFWQSCSSDASYLHVCQVCGDLQTNHVNHTVPSYH